MKTLPSIPFIGVHRPRRQLLERIDMVKVKGNEFVCCEPLLTCEEALKVVLENLKAGNDILLGDTHTETSHHLFYALAVKLASSSGIQFVSGLELPSQLDEELNNFVSNPRAHVDFAMSAIKRYYPRMGQLENSLRGFILPTLQSLQVQVIPLDMYPRPRESSENDDLVNEYMAHSLRDGKSNHEGLPVLGLVGAYHVKQEAIPKYSSNNMICLHLGTNATFHDDPETAIYKPGDFDGIVDLEAFKK